MKKYQKMFEKGKKEDEPTMMNDLSVNSELDSPKQGYMNKSPKQVETVILAGMQFRGDIKGSHNLFLNGEFDGTVDLNALLFVGQSGRLTGEVKAERVIIEGEVEGTVTANEKIELREGGKCKGDILAPSVMISDKAFFQGQVTMTNTEDRSESSTATGTFSQSSLRRESESPKITVVDSSDVGQSEDEDDSDEAKQRRRKLSLTNEK
ncbi:polymer-forming cytoskeletal protein [candidate division KSB1 bacterium]|nr:polymer-forming cytoskeletal protein [candidate division KSB1 bacterium]